LRRRSEQENRQERGGAQYSDPRKRSLHA
jgi:hypothetical protein